MHAREEVLNALVWLCQLMTQCLLHINTPTLH